MALAAVLSWVNPVNAAAKYEPPDGSIYYGYCLSGYWSDAEFDRNIDTIYNTVSDKPFVLMSIFVHAMENGRWNGWEYRPEGPNGKYVHGSGDYVKKVVEKGYVPVLAWTWMDWLDHSQSPTIQGLLRGEYDWYIDEWIEGIKSLDSPIFIRLSHEMDGYWYPYSEGYHGDPDRNTAEEWVQYWRYVVDRFRAAGVDNVAWVWCVDGGRAGVRDWVDYYPGDEYVDWIAADIYSNRHGGEALLEFREAMGDHKPIMIPEGGTEDLLTPYHPNYPGNSVWIDQFYSAILNEMAPQVKAVCWFQWNDVSWVERDPQQLEVYRKFIERPEFISTFYEGGDSSSSDTPQPVQTGINVPQLVELPLDGKTHTIQAQYVGFEGKIGSSWALESGDSTGLQLWNNGSTGYVIPKKAGNYTIKIQAWDGPNWDYNFVDVKVTDSNSTPDPTPTEPTNPPTSSGPTVQVQDSVELKLGETKTISANITGFIGAVGGNWGIEAGSASGLGLSDKLYTCALTGKTVGEYRVKVQAWDKSDNHASDYIRVIISKDGSTTNPPTSGDDEEPSAPEPSGPFVNVTGRLQLEKGGLAKTVFAELGGFVGNVGGNWKVEEGDASGLEIIDNLTSATIRGLKAGEYRIKIQAWDKHDNHASDYLTVLVGEAAQQTPVEPSIIAPDWLEIEVGGSYNVESIFSGFTATGSNWGLPFGESNGIKIEPKGQTAVLTGKTPGDYVVKVQAWNGPIHVSKHIRVTVVNTH